MNDKACKRVGIVVAAAEVHCRKVTHGIAAVGYEAGWEWLVVPTEAASLLVPAVSLLDGVIGSMKGVAAGAPLFQSNLPIVDFSYAETLPKVAYVRTDDVAVGRLAAAYLLSLGITRYGYFGWRGHHESDRRERGFRDTLVAAGLCCESFHWPAAGQRDDEAVEPAIELVRWVAGLGKPVGLFARDDRHALKLLAACHQLGLGVPDSVAILGVENDELFCELANPAISSIALPTQRIGYEAARMLERMMQRQPHGHEPMLIPPAGVVPRASTDRPVIVDPDVAAAVRYIAMHAKDQLQVSDVLREVLVSRRSLDQRFLKALGRTTAQEISQARVEIAKQALTATTGSMETIAAIAGFTNAKQLGASFRKTTGMTPSAYRHKHALIGTQRSRFGDGLSRL